jgi:hypothetical protein
LRQLGPSLAEPVLAGSTVSVASSDAPETLTERVNAIVPSQLGVRTMTVRRRP